MRKIISLLMVVVVCLVCFVGCDNGTYNSGPMAQPQYDNTGHQAVVDQMSNISMENTYYELLVVYNSVIAHQSVHQCSLDMQKLMEYMLMGEWKDSAGKYINYTYVYEDYDNTKGYFWFGTDLPNTKKAGSTYYYNIRTVGNTLVIDYEDQITNERVDNYTIAFNVDSITLFNAANNQTYVMTSNPAYSKVQKGNAKLAYECIAKQINTFKNPSSVVVTGCYVDYAEKVVYARIQATNGFGGTISTDYKLYEAAGYYHITESSYNYSTNIDLDELNNKLQTYFGRGNA